MSTSQIQRTLGKMRDSGKLTSSLFTNAHQKVDRAVDLFYLALQMNRPHLNPDFNALVDHDRISPYTLHPSPTRDPIFNSGQTSRINVGHFIAELLTNDETWARWTDRAPVLYNDPSHGLAGPQDPPA